MLPLDRSDQMLINQVQTYLRTSLNYNILRSHCLAVAPVQPVVIPLFAQLDSIAAEEKTRATVSLTQQAHDRQIEQDIAQEYSDKLSASTYKTEKEDLESTISSLRWERITVEALYIAHQVIHSNAYSKLQQARSRINELEKSIHDHTGSTGHAHPGHEQHQHQHPSDSFELQQLKTQLAEERDQVSRLHEQEREELCIFINHQTNKARIEREISNAEARIKRISEQEKNLKTRDMERNQRRCARANYPNELTEKALSSLNINQLQNAIRTQFSSINTQCQQMKKLAEMRCYPVFLNQLESHVDTLLCLSLYEKMALKQIIIAMNEYQLDVSFRVQQESELLRLEAALQSEQKSYASKTAEYEALTNRNNHLINSNELLNSALSSLEYRHEKLLKQRNNYALGALAATGITGAGSLTAYFLIQAGIMSSFVGLIGVAVLGTATLGLIITTSILAIMASLKNNEVNTCKQSISNNNNESDQNGQIMASQKIDLPNLTKNIERLKQQITEQGEITDAACQKEKLSLENAGRIQVYVPGVGHHHHNSFFSEASAPPMAEARSCSSDIYQETPIMAEARPCSPDTYQETPMPFSKH